MFGYNAASSPRHVGSAVADVVLPIILNGNTPIGFHDITIDTGSFFDVDGITIHLAANTGYLLMCSAGVTGTYGSTTITAAWLVIASPDLSTSWTNDTKYIEPSFVWTDRIDLYLPPQMGAVDITFFAVIGANEEPGQTNSGTISIIEI